MKEFLSGLLCISVLLSVLVVGRPGLEFDEEEFWDKIPVAFYDIEFDIFESAQTGDADNVLDVVKEIWQVLCSPFRYVNDVANAVKFLFTAKPVDMEIQQYGGRAYLYTKEYGWLVCNLPLKDQNPMALYFYCPSREMSLRYSLTQQRFTGGGFGYIEN